MKKVALIGVGMLGGFAAAMIALPEAKGANDTSAYGQLDLFSDAFERVRANYVRPVKDSELIDAAIQGMVSNLDPHSSYMDAKMYGDMQITTKGQFGGVGIEVTQEDGVIKVISPIDGTSIAGLQLNEAIDKMRGSAGSKITLTVVREGEKKPFDVTLVRAALIVGTAIATQKVASRLAGIAFDPKSAAISGLSLSLLLRSESLALLLAAAAIAVGSKFVVRVRGKHVFNPTNFAIVALLIITNRVWVSPGQWGSVAFFGFLIACIGGLVVNREARSDVTFAFIAAWSALVIGRSLWLGEPLTIPFHRLENGALLLFTCFMISDPKTTPDSRAGRVLFAAAVALGGWYINYRLFRTNGILWSLAACSLFVPVLDLVLRAKKYEWGHEVSRSRGLAVPHPETSRPRDLATAPGGAS